MDINFVSRKDINISKKSSSKYRPLLEAIQQLEAGGKAIQVSYDDKAELNSMRNVIYSYNRQENENVKTSKHPDKKVVFFFLEDE
ncbi:hypothetical protein [Fodinibius halophilus]|uniref:Uncharacterized protein n=1 Tax=Fodinibius halophilus TaxID=1736908 RepID=A0A6M1T1C2_9BACT|nr:hypothetical protein [Fodinibius halophilus]NGP87769.1 hypothetical protein [Fodinibius halophilus]